MDSNSTLLPQNHSPLVAKIKTKRRTATSCLLETATMSRDEHRNNTRSTQGRTRPTGSRHYCPGTRHREQQSCLTSPYPPENIRRGSCAHPSGSESTLGKSQRSE